MKNVDDLIDSAKGLADEGLSRGEIADELNVSRETAAWLVERGGGQTATASSSPHDIHVDWSALGRDSTRLDYAGKALAHLLTTEHEEIDLVVGIEKAGTPLATVVARSLEADLATYAPSKHQWEEGDISDLGGTFSKNFAAVRDRDCVVVDDTITSGTTMRETITTIDENGGEPLAGGVLVDKQGYEDIDGIPVYSLLQVLRMGDGP